jgi:hypothetical protein
MARREFDREGEAGSQERLLKMPDQEPFDAVQMPVTHRCPLCTFYLRIPRKFGLHLNVREQTKTCVAAAPNQTALAKFNSLSAFNFGNKAARSPRLRLHKKTDPPP